jgi:hypothetical protein
VPLEKRCCNGQLIRTWKTTNCERAVRCETLVTRFAGDFPELQEAVDPTELGNAIDRAVVTDPALVNRRCR